MYRSYESDNENGARAKLRVEVECWTWMSRKRKEEIISSATFQRTDTRFGPMFSTTVRTN